MRMVAPAGAASLNHAYRVLTRPQSAAKVHCWDDDTPHSMTDINYSAALGEAPSADSASKLLWSFNGVKMLAGPGGSVILHKLSGDRRVIVQPDVAEALRQCAPFRTIEAHTRRIIETSPLLKEHAEQPVRPAGSCRWRDVESVMPVGNGSHRRQPPL